jgi:hypothetical protein
LKDSKDKWEELIAFQVQGVDLPGGVTLYRRLVEDVPVSIVGSTAVPVWTRGQRDIIVISHPCCLFYIIAFTSIRNNG